MKSCDLSQEYHHSPRGPIALYYCDQHEFSLPPGHKFPLRKYRGVRELLNGDPRFDIRPAIPAVKDDLLRVHAREYVDNFLSGSLEASVMRRIGFPWSCELVTRTLSSVGGTVSATHSALATGVSGTLAGGTHHAFRDAGSGFCVFNDLAVAIAWARNQRGIRKVAVVDLDVHQGDGTAQIFAGEAGVFTLSVHAAKNFPFRKQMSVLDVELPDGAMDTEYLEQLEPALCRVWDFEPELVFYQSGVDALATDRLGRLALTLEGLRERDRLVLRGTRELGVPLVITMGGGYSEPIGHTVAAHVSHRFLKADRYRANYTGQTYMAAAATPEHENGGERIRFQTNCRKGEEVVVKVVVRPRRTN